MDTKEQWKDDVLNSLDDIQRALPDEILFSQIMAKLPKNTLTTDMPTWHLRWAGAAACLLVILNLYVLSSDNSQQQTATAQTEAVESIENTSLFTDYSLY